ncbi:DUF6876 family protein [Bradyrhizobium sp. ORS 111]|uniref:DUF6876 family protein n=1 Tax=Bradyrhizobium sp. ORS 111 TaxID=1685958 RepID=UPI00388D634F
MTKLTPGDLATGTAEWYRDGLNRHMLYTDGVPYLAEKDGAYWLLDKIACLQLEPKIGAEEFQVWRLQVMDNRSARLVCDDGNATDAVLHSEDIDFTDFPLDDIAIWGNVILLPSEH